MEEGRARRVRADKIDIKSLDKQLERHLDRLCSIDNNMKKGLPDYQETKMMINSRAVAPKRDGDDWLIMPDKLVVKQVFARGTFGKVHRGLYNGQEVAVKVLELGEEGQRTKDGIVSLENFRQEVSVWHKLDHPNITKCIGATTDTSQINLQGKEVLSTDSACVIAEYLSGGNLKSYLIKHRQNKLPLGTLKQLAVDLARGLNYLHSKNIVHRDVKAENLLLDQDGRLKIGDFGVARIEAENSKDMTGNTGTPGYMAPEVLKSEPYNRKCDVYSFGICLWEMYCCKMAYAKLTPTQLTSAVVYRKLRPEIPRSCPRSLAKVMERCWDAEPNRRPEMEEVVSMLEAVDAHMLPGCFGFFSSTR